MYTPTQNYGLAMPSYGDEADIGVINDMVTAKVDELLFQNRTISAPPFETTEAYAEGDLVVYENVLYRFTADKTAGAWDSSKVVQTSLAAEIEDRGSGANALADLTDTDIDAPAEGEVLTWDGEKWVNAEGTPSVTKTATGNPIEFSDGADAPLVKCTTAITGSQDLHGYDKPWVGGAGKNKLPLTVSGIKANNTSGTWSGNAYTINDITFTIETDGDGNVTDIKVNGTASSNADLQIGGYFGGTTLFAQSGSYTTSINNTVFSMIVGYGNNVVIRTSDSDTQTFSDGISWAILRVLSGTTVNNQIATPMIRLATVSDSTFEPYSNICPITAYTEWEIEVRGKNMIPPAYITHSNPTAIRAWHADSGVEGTFLKAGTYTFFSDKGRANGLYVNKYENGTATTIFTKYNATYFTFTLTEDTDGISLYLYFTNGGADDYGMELVEGTYSGEYEPYTSTTHTATFSQSIYQGNADFVGSTASGEKVLINLEDLTWGAASGDGRRASNDLTSVIKKVNNNLVTSAITNKYPSMSANDIANGSDLGIAVNQDGYVQIRTEDPNATPTGQFVYELATPSSETITPTNLPIKSLFGYNHIESSTGEMEIEYFPQKEQPLIDLIPEASNMHTYSTEEHAVGTWVDGSTIYERSIDLGSFSIGSEGTYIIEQATDIDLLIDYDGYVIENSIMYALPDPSIRIKMDSNKDLIFSGTASWYVSSGYLTIRYTKTSSNNRSLSKGATGSLKADLSEVKDEGEEILKGDEKALKIDESEDTETKETDETEGNADEMQDETVTE